MSTRPRVDSAVPGAPAEFGTVMMHAPEIISKFGDLYAEFWQRGIVSQEIKEMTRIRNARITDCGF
ncbi:MAG: hypothetical protein ISP91_14100 [Pseudomonadales bacterium]|nr:hypothetical protein [Pseudomonadales bacterium]